MSSPHTTPLAAPMAQMIPESILSKASQGEKLLFHTLRDRLPDTYIVWYEPTINRNLPDFIILGPTFGLLVIEVGVVQPWD